MANTHSHHSRLPTFQPVSAGVTLGLARTCSTRRRKVGSALRPTRAIAWQRPTRVTANPKACSRMAAVFPYGNPKPLLSWVASATARGPSGEAALPIAFEGCRE